MEIFTASTWVSIFDLKVCSDCVLHYSCCKTAMSCCMQFACDNRGRHCFWSLALVAARSITSADLSVCGLSLVWLDRLLILFASRYSALAFIPICKRRYNACNCCLLDVARACNEGFRPTKNYSVAMLQAQWILRRAMNLHRGMNLQRGMILRP